MWKAGASFGGLRLDLSDHDLEIISSLSEDASNSYRGFKISSQTGSRDVYPDLRATSKRLLPEEFVGLLADFEEVIISPSKSLASFPFGLALVNGSDKHLVEQIAISYTPSIRLHREFGERYKLRAPDQDAQFIGIGLRNFERFNSVNHLQLSRLEETVTEVMETREQFAETEAEMLLEESATEGRIRHLSEQGILERYRYVLFSTHGVFTPGDTSKSFLALNPSESSGEGFDGMLTPGDISTLALSADLVFLSACETGLSEESKSEALLGLPYAFFLAGARQVIATFWNVDDESSRLFVKHFFRNLVNGSRTSVSQALRKTKIAFLRGDYPGYEHPRFWSGYALYGG